MQIEHLALDALIPYARNSRTHSDEQVAQVAASIREFGFTNPVLIDGDGGIIAGHGRVMAARKLGLADVPCIRLAHLTESKKRAYIIADNKLALNAGWDEILLALELCDLADLGYDTGLTGFDSKEIDALLAGLDATPKGATDADAVPEVQHETITKPGDVWLLGPHRIMCGDSTSATDVERLMAGKKAALIHADPPYGMGFEIDGVANDNLYFEKLADFQMQWWRAFLPHCEGSASGYVWGWEDSLFDFYLRLRADDSQRITKRNYIVWNKKNGQGINQESLRRFAPVTEHALFFMLGEQGFNTNAENYWEGFEPTRKYLDDERKKSGLTTTQCNQICGKQNMTQSAFTRGGFRLILREDYEKLRDACNGIAFKREHDDLKREHDDLKREFYATRAYFDNTHDAMTDVWEFQRVTGEERHGHATPKPVAMMQRVMKSSLPPGGLCAEPFGGSGSTLMGAETTGRTCYTMELQAQYVDVAVRRWQNYTGKRATLEATGEPFPDTATVNAKN